MSVAVGSFLMANLFAGAIVNQLCANQTIPCEDKLRDFRVYWNVPSFMCHKYELNFDDVSIQYGMIQNLHDDFRGDDFVILYDPGEFPALFKLENGSMILRNGGVPQEGNLTRHLEAFEKAVKTDIPDESFEGIAVIDFERWRPIYRQNWGTLQIYKDQSIYIEKQKHPDWSKGQIQHEAIERFEKYGRIFMEESLKLAKKLRPSGKWGYYGYPQCYNSPTQKKCASKISIENDRISWLFSKMDVLLPSVYMNSAWSVKQKKDFVEGRVNEALRISKNLTEHPKVLAYYWYKYNNDRELYVIKDDLDATFEKISDVGADGIVIWGSSYDMNSKDKCNFLYKYLQHILGPAVRTAIKAAESNNSTQTQKPS